ncbi:MAG: kinase [Solirubrobacteraceae bacterium]
MATAPVPTRLALVVHPTRAVDAALAALVGWSEERGVPLIQLAVPGDGGRSLVPAGTLEPGDLVLALGGDGTVLSALRAAAARGAPVLGIACGSLGALSAVTAEELAGALDRVWAGEWTPRSLPGLAVDDGSGQGEWAANDFVVVRRGAGQLVAELSIDDELYARVAGDGLIVATALGSSAYSMAAGGPVLAAGTPAFVCTPLAMHGGSAPPLVVGADVTATVVVQPGFAGFDVEIDGHDHDLEGPRFALTLHTDKLTLVTFGASGRGLTGLRKRLLVFDSPRVLARDERDKRIS